MDEQNPILLNVARHHVWGVFSIDDRPKQVAPCTPDGLTAHFLYEVCPCGTHFDGDLLVHEDSL